MNSQADITNLDLLPVRDGRGGRPDLARWTALDTGATCVSLAAQTDTHVATGCLAFAAQTETRAFALCTSRPSRW